MKLRRLSVFAYGAITLFGVPFQWTSANQHRRLAGRRSDFYVGVTL
jgi:hypothetical protein